MSYATVAECRAWIGRPGTTPTPDDVLAAVLASACEDIDAHCGRSFAVAPVDAEVTSRVYVADSPRVLIDDVCVIDDVEESEDGVAWTPVDVTWHAEPWNATPVTTIVGDGELRPQLEARARSAPSNGGPAPDLSGPAPCRCP